jgi:tight adherence protein C
MTIFGIVADPVLPAALGCTFLAVTLVVAGLLWRGDPDAAQIARSLKTVESLQAFPRSALDQELERPFGERVVQPLMQGFTGLGRRLTPKRQILGIRTRLDLAGNPAGWDADRVLGLKALGAVALTLVAGVLSRTIAANALAMVFAALGGGTLGWFAPTLWIYQVGYDRCEVIRKTLPDAIDLLTISVESGLGFDAALAQVARNTDGPLAAEFFRVLQEMQIGTGRLDAMRAMTDRTNVPELKTFVGAMVQADAFGIPIAKVLRIQARELRTKRSQRAEAAAQKVPVTILFPLVFCILPTLFIVILGPLAINLMVSGLGQR